LRNFLSSSARGSYRWGIPGVRSWREARDGSVLFDISLMNHHFATHNSPLATHHSTITSTDQPPRPLALALALSCSRPRHASKGLRHTALSLVSGDVVKSRRRPAPMEAKTQKRQRCRQRSDRIKTHCASSPAHVREMKRVRRYHVGVQRRGSRYRYMPYGSACYLNLDL